MTLLKNICLGALLGAVSLTAAAQAVEKSIYSVQAGPVGIWVNNESRLADKFALRTEIGFDTWYYDTYNGSGQFLAPSISFEPRWYYNIEKRNTKGKHTANNSANFVTIAFEYFPDLFTIGGHPDYVTVPDQVTVIPKWGMRRAIAGSKFNYELGAGIGYIGYLSSQDARTNDGSDVGIDLHVRIGYTF